MPLFPVLVPVMPMATRKSNASAHPGHIVIQSQQTKRTKQQIEEDKAKAKQAAIAKKESEAARHHAVIARIRELEDTEEVDKVNGVMHAHWPDLQVCHQPPLIDPQPAESESDASASDKSESEDNYSGDKGQGDSEDSKDPEAQVSGVDEEEQCLPKIAKPKTKPKLKVSLTHERDCSIT